MNLPRSVAGQRPLRLLALASALTLAACGGGGGGAPADASSGFTTEITSDTQSAVAADAGSTVSALDPSASLFMMLGTMPPIISAAPEALDVTRKAVVASPAALLRAVADKFLPTAPADIRLAAGDTTTTRAVDCTSGSGTLTETFTAGESEIPSGQATLSLKKCATTVDSMPVVMDGTLRIQLAGSSGAPYLLTYDLLATGYSVRGESFETLIDGDMRLRVEADTDVQTVTVSGKKLTFGQAGTPPSLGTGVEGPKEMRTTTLADYRQQVGVRGDRASIEASALVETEVLGEATTYALSTPKALVFAEDIFRSGRLQVVGAGGTTLHIVANGDGTFKLERDDGGDGTIDDTVSPVDAEDLNLRGPLASPL